MPLVREFCGFCGSPFLPGVGSPRKCSDDSLVDCGKLTFLNPTPVAVLLVQVPGLAHDPDRPGLVVVKRKNEPAAGRLALPGGYMELGESWQTACTRELWEETSIEVLASEVELFDVHSVDGGERVIVFGITKGLVDFDLDTVNERVKNNTEVSEVSEIHSGDWLKADIPFSTHRKVVAKFFDRAPPPSR